MGKSERFWSKVAKGSESECWLWQGGKDRNGYGLVSIGKLCRAHRMAWKLTHGPIPKGLHVCHTCDVPACCNPNHLFLGTHSANMRDMVNKGRHASTAKKQERQQRQPRAKLSEQQVVEIRRLYATGDYTQEQLGSMFGVARSRISELLHRKTWGHVP